ncbi:hypothetical protein A2997_01635 [Candidatus Nomurabacteria bacterium RIFCSPLOWO2_01_FULL_36_10b]|uniref:Uncharacterized protein n=1 Tax=Candidatus Nomurabacteria bacterium RIFCSPLOWO2_01_FULL_36_10b TaxID=1801766 RepID=A0A1F6WNG1_9BACT|nr:MAG: hypothetical protein A2997_01635 [Candidatus Nomurabacteria bacterium RIFCSPLOWO2_01_FULL_36_10b]
MITDTDIKKLKKVFATKKDLEAFATKRDLELYLTKDEFRVFERKLDKKFIDFEESLLTKIIDHILTSQDVILKRIDDIIIDNAARDMQLHRHDKWIHDLATHTECKLSNS